MRTLFSKTVPKADSSAIMFSKSRCINHLFKFKIIQYLLVCFTFLVVKCQAEINNEVGGLIQISEKNITAYSNRNLTIVCYANLNKRRDESLHFTPNARMVLTFLTVPRTKKPLHQMQSFLHCNDPNRTDCLAEFNLDISCVEDQLPKGYIKKVYFLEVACQVDDLEVCSVEWVSRQSLDCYDLGQVKVVEAPKLNEKCLDSMDNQTLDCGYHQVCSTKYGICLCETNYIASNRQCVPAPYQDLVAPETTLRFTTDSSTYTSQPDGPTVATAGNHGTFKAIVIFLLTVAILLCIALGIVIIWSRHYRRLIEDINNS